jgi:hypothetical protein
MRWARRMARKTRESLGRIDLAASASPLALVHAVGLHQKTTLDWTKPLAPHLEGDVTLFD